MTKEDWVFICRKCGHNLFVDKQEVKKLLRKNDSCPNCGEESYENWILSREGSYKKEYPPNN